MREGQDAIELWLRRLELRSPLSEADRETVRNFSGQIRRYGSSRDVVRLGETVQHCCLIVEGMVARFGQTIKGHRQLTALYIPGDMGDLHSAVLPVVSAPLQSLQHATVMLIPHEQVRSAQERSTALGRALWRDCVADAQIASEWLLTVGRRGALARIAHLLCELSCRYQAVGISRLNFPLHLTQTHVGECLGLTGVHVNRMLRMLRERALIDIDAGRLTVLDWGALCSVGDFDPAYLHLERVVER